MQKNYDLENIKDVLSRFIKDSNEKNSNVSESN